LMVLSLTMLNKSQSGDVLVREELVYLLELEPETTLIANVGDQSVKNAVRLKEAGFSGVYHALRLREGKDTGLSVEKRKQSIANLKASPQKP
jgi:hypothetical protein